MDDLNTDLKLSKRLNLPGKRSVLMYMSVSNLLNRKVLSGSALSTTAQDDYKRYVFGQRNEDKDVKYGDESTFFVLTEPYRDPSSGAWHAPLSPRTDWLHHLNPRYYRFGVRFSL